MPDMKVISLNTWGGRVYQPLFDFLAQHATNTDIFCLQEIFNFDKAVFPVGKHITNIYTQIEAALPDHVGFHDVSLVFEQEANQLPFGLAVFVKKNIPIIQQGAKEIFAAHDAPRLDLKEGELLWHRLLQYVTVSFENNPVTIFNFHGLYTGKGKNDQASRLEQSEKVKEIMQTFEGDKILCGDFNLNPNTESMKILEEGMRNLIKENGITSTRSHHYPKESKFADYILVSPGVHVKEFKVLDDVVSDHLPMSLIIL